MQPLSYICTFMDGMSTQGWANKGSIVSATSVVTILQDLALLMRTKHIYASIGRIKGADNTISDDASRLTHLPNWMFLHHFALAFPQKKPWRLIFSVQMQVADDFHAAHQVLLRVFSATV